MYKDLIEIPDISARVFLDLNLHQQTSNIKDLIEIPDISARVFLDLNLHQVERNSCQW